MYAQTVVYGLFIARYNDKTLNGFDCGEAIINLSKESQLLKQFFQHIATPAHTTLNDAIEKLCKLFSIADVAALLDKREPKDTVVHFYEEFLSYYDPAERKAFGAFYTPVEVVRYMVKSVDKFLAEELNIKGGLSNNETADIEVDCTPYHIGRKELTKKSITVPRVAILDPACGTGTFHAEIIKFVKEKYFSGANAVFYKEWIRRKDGLLSRLIAFEIMMTGYIVARLKICRTVVETAGEAPEENLPVNIFLTNALSEPKSSLKDGGELNIWRLIDFSCAITEEAKNADNWKARRPIKVIIGNPPYLASSVQPFDISAYKFEPDGGTKLNEATQNGLTTIT
ncbi:MAG: N-6 DNA methylase [Clostridiales bacterium]|jgi:predicted helicase|nr:N-6 DNA methylase [Clostridiales bacterium]